MRVTYNRKLRQVLMMITLLLVILAAVTSIVTLTKPAIKPTSGRIKPAAGGKKISGSGAADPLFPDFVKVCGVHLCIQGKQWEPYFASTYAASHHLSWDISAAVQGHLNTLRINNFLAANGDPRTAAYDEARWEIVDRFIASARSNGLHVVFDLSSYRNLTGQGGTQNPYLVDWKPFLTFVMHRINTVTHVGYAIDTTIALFALAGEVDPPHGTNRLHVTTQQINTFFARTTREFKDLDRHHPLSPGGIYQLNWDSGIDYKTIFSMRGFDVCALHAPPPPYGGDAAIVAQFCAGIHKPWIWEEFFQPQGVGDQARARFYLQTYVASRQLNAAGIGFWNLGPGLGANNDDVGPQTPLTWQVIMNNAPPPFQPSSLAIMPTHYS